MLKLKFSNTDSERFKILRSCNGQFEKNNNYLINFFSEDNLVKFEKNHSIFSKIDQYNCFLQKEQEKLHKEFTELFEKARLYFTHYYQVMFLAIERGELTPAIAELYGLKFPFTIPYPKTPEQLLQMSEHLFGCDDSRVASGGKYFANPSIGSVKVWIEKFIEVYEKKTNKFNVKQAEVENIECIRLETDGLINDIYKSILAEISDFDETDQIIILEQYGFDTEIEYVKEIVEIPEDTHVLFVEEEIGEKKPRKRRKSKNINQLQFSFLFPE